MYLISWTQIILTHLHHLFLRRWTISTLFTHDEAQKCAVNRCVCKTSLWAISFYFHRYYRRFIFMSNLNSIEMKWAFALAINAKVVSYVITDIFKSKYHMWKMWKIIFQNTHTQKQSLDSAQNDWFEIGWTMFFVNWFFY